MKGQTFFKWKIILHYKLHNPFRLIGLECAFTCALIKIHIRRQVFLARIVEGVIFGPPFETEYAKKTNKAQCTRNLSHRMTQWREFISNYWRQQANKIGLWYILYRFFHVPAFIYDKQEMVQLKQHKLLVHVLG